MLETFACINLFYTSMQCHPVCLVEFVAKKLEMSSNLM